MYKITELDNGLRVLTTRMPYLHSVSLCCFLEVGSRHESDVVAGASHFIEHMLFKGTMRRPSARHIADAIEGRGGMFNASTGLETTLYWAKVAAADLPDTLDVMSDMLLHAKFDPTEMEKERTVIAEEIKYILDTPDTLAQIMVNRLQWPNHPLGRDVAGTQQSVANMDRDMLLTYKAEHYLPGSAIIAMAGQLYHDQAVEWVSAHLGDWAPGTRSEWEPAPSNHHGPHVRVACKETEQAHVVFSFEGFARDHPQRHNLRLLNVILGEGMRSRLFQEIRERRGLAYSVDSFVSTLQDTGAVGIYAGVAAHRVRDTIHAVLLELDRMRQEPIPEDELQAAKDFMRGRMALTMEDSSAVASLYARQVLLGPEVLGPSEVIERFERVQAADLQQLAQEVFQTGRLNLVVVGPFPDDSDEFSDLAHL